MKIPWVSELRSRLKGIRMQPWLLCLGILFATTTYTSVEPNTKKWAAEGYSLEWLYNSSKDFNPAESEADDFTAAKTYRSSAPKRILLPSVNHFSLAISQRLKAKNHLIRAPPWFYPSLLKNRWMTKTI